MSNSVIVDREALRLAAEADPCDPRTAARYLRGDRVRGRVAERLAQAARALGLRSPDSTPPTCAA